MNRDRLIFIIIIVVILAVGGFFYYQHYMREDNCSRLVDFSIVEEKIDGRGYSYEHKGGRTAQFSTKKEAVRLCEQMWRFDRETTTQ